MGREDERRAEEAMGPGEVGELVDDGRAGEPPVVARLVVEIRSDGSRTVARGAIDDAQTGQKVAVEAKGDSPLELAGSLAKVIARAPFMAGSAARALRAERSPAARQRPERPGLARRALRRVLRRR